MKYFYVNNLKINYVPNNRSIIEYCENLGINIPHYCYHPNLSIAGNCRMCLVEVKGTAKPVISCAMTLLNKMVIYTDSPLVKKSREAILEFLLLNHPLDCPICDQGGECDLQDQSFVFGINKKRFYNFKRVVTNKQIGCIVKTVMTRCIHCTRCVRFSSEVAGSGELGTYGRGVSTEIGTYVNNVFNSELSGNVIDICPVGALTSKQYPFISRIWELKNIKSYDFSDSSVSNIQLYLKSNTIVKILPGYDDKDKKNNWISDKTRFSFDGMFSPERVSNLTLNNTLQTSWSQIFENITSLLYFQSQFLRHSGFNFNIYILFNKNIDIETSAVLNNLVLKFPFIRLRALDNNYDYSTNIDFENNYLLKNSVSSSFIHKSNICFLFNINPRYDNTKLNIILRQRFLKGNFKILSFNPNLDYTYPVINLGSNIKVLKSVIEGNNLFCQEFGNSFYPIFLTSSSLFSRKDSNNIFNMLYYLKLNTHLLNSNWNGFNILSLVNNEVGLKSLKTYKSISSQDYYEASNFFCLDIDFNSINLKKLIELKLLNLIFLNSLTKFIVEGHNIFKGKFLNVLKKNLQSSLHISLPNKVFFETTKILQSNRGNFIKSLKVIKSNNIVKNNWQILRKLNYSLDTISFNNNSCLSKINYSFNSLNCLDNYIWSLYLPSKNFNSYLKFVSETVQFSDKNFFTFSKPKKKNTNDKIKILSR